MTAGTKSRRTLRKVKTKFPTNRTVINIVPTSASSAAFLRVMVGVWTLVGSGATLATAGLPRVSQQTYDLLPVVSQIESALDFPE